MTGAWKSDMYTQEIVPSIGIRLERHPLSVAGGDVAGAVDAAVRVAATTPFNYARPPLLAATLFRIDRDDHVLTLTVPHIIADGYSTAVIERDSLALYASLLGAPHEPLPALAVSYADFAFWERACLARGEFDSQMRYWRDKWLACRDRLFTHTELSFSRSGADENPMASRSTSETVEFDWGTSMRIREVIASLRVTPYALFRTCVGLALQRRSGRPSAPLWFNSANRCLAETEDMVGWLVNSHIVYSELTADCRGIDAVTVVQASIREALLHQSVPLQALWNAIGHRLYLGFTDVRIAVDYSKAVREREVGDIKARRMWLSDAALGRGLDVMAIEGRERFAIKVRYAVDVYSPAGVRGFLNDVRACVTELVEAPERRVDEYCQSTEPGPCRKM